VDKAEKVQYLTRSSRRRGLVTYERFGSVGGRWTKSDRGVAGSELELAKLSGSVRWSVNGASMRTFPV
jgi:hypothetical protein